MTRVIGTFQDKSDVIKMVDKLKKDGVDIRNITVLMSEEGNRTVSDDDIVHGVGIERLATKDDQDSGIVSKMKSVLNTKDEKDRRAEKEDRMQALGLSEEEAEKYRKEIDKNKSYVVITQETDEQAEAEAGPDQEGWSKVDDTERKSTEESSREKEEEKTGRDKTAEQDEKVGRGPGIIDEAPPTHEAVETHDTDRSEEIKEKEEVVDKNQQKLTDRNKREKE